MKTTFNKIAVTQSNIFNPLSFRAIFLSYIFRTINRLKKLIFPAISITSLALASGCATQQETSYPSFTATPIGQNSPTEAFTQKTDTLLVVLDASLSTNEIYDGKLAGDTKFSVEKQILHNINKTIPQNITLYSGLHTFGLSGCDEWRTQKQVQAINRYSAKAFQDSLDQAQCTGGGSPMESALSAIASDIDKAPGNIALLVISDGHGMSSTALSETQALEAKLGDRLCAYSVWVGNHDEQEGKPVLQGLSAITGCGTNVSATELNSSPDVADFVERILFTKTAVVAEVETDDASTATDSYPTKSAELNVDPIWSFNDIKFEIGKAAINPSYAPSFANAVHILELTPSITVQIAGHTDNDGSNSYNQTLSTRRAQAVKAHFVSQGIKADRLTVKGFGNSLPIASNDTQADRALNRRVELTITDK